MSTVQNDHAVKIPAAVAAAAARADALMQPEPAPEGNEEAAPEGVTEESNPEATPGFEAAAEPAPSPTSDWEHQYRSMKGRYDRAIEENRDLQRRIAVLEAEAQVPRSVTPTPDFQVEDLSEEEINDYGPDMIKVVEKIAARAAARATSSVAGEMNELAKKVGGVAAVTEHSEKERFYQNLTNKVDNWREINSNPQFIQWLQYPDTYSGRERMDMLKSAYNSMDAARCAAFFEGFLKETAAVVPQDTVQPGQAAAPKPSLDQFAAPGRAMAATTAPGAADEKPIFTAAQISAFYTDQSRGKFRGREKEASRIEAQIFEAQRDGRIRT